MFKVTKFRSKWQKFELDRVDCISILSVQFRTCLTETISFNQAVQNISTVTPGLHDIELI